MNPDFEQIDKALMEIKINAEHLRKLLPPQRLTVVYLISGLSVNDGSNTLIINDIDKVNLTYKLYRIEARIRILARRFPESHHICLFACARRSLSTFKLTANDKMAFDAAIQASLSPDVAQEVIR
jgi:hypothetical protein